MNLYVLVEGKQTERRLYPSWLSFIVPSLVKVESLSQLQGSHYYLISGEGYPRMIDITLVNALKDISENKEITNFWVVMDSEGFSPQDRMDFVKSEILKSGIDISHCKVEVLIQDPCIETWGLGNKVIISKNKIQGDFADYYNHYNVNDLDPEMMKHPPEYSGSIAKYHESYLKSMLSLRNATYTKKNPVALMEESYLNQLISRSNDGSNHLSSFSRFYQSALNLCPPLDLLQQDALGDS